MTNKNQINPETNKSEATYLSPIAYAKLIGKQPQQIYQMIKKDNFPDDIVKLDGIQQKPMINVEAMNNYMATRGGKAAGSGPILMSSNPEKILEMLVGWFNEAGQTDLANSLKGVHDKIVAAKQPEEVKQ